MTVRNYRSILTSAASLRLPGKPLA